MITLAGLLLLGAASATFSYRQATHVVAWPDECIYLVGARNIVERGTLSTNFYLTYSLLRRRYPHRDVHMPGYILALSPVVARMGSTHESGVVLNAVMFLASIPLVYGLGRALLEEHHAATVAAGLYTVLPPFPAYLSVVYPEIVVAFVFLAALLWLLTGTGLHHAFGAGVLFSLGALFRETLLVALPLYVARLSRRDLVRGFVPGALATLLLVVAPFSRDRAVHPNALYPSVVEDALRSSAPVGVLLTALRNNVLLNLRLAAEADPLREPEDTALAFFAVLSLAAALALPRLNHGGRRMGRALFLSLGLLTAAMLLLYVVRAKGGVWGGVRAYMPFAPLLLILATPLLFRLRRWWLRTLLAALVAAGFATLDHRQIRFFNRYKGTDIEDQERAANYIARHIDRHGPRRILGRVFTYGLTHYPVEVIWSLPRDYKEMIDLENAVGFDFAILHERSPIRLHFVQNPRYVRINKDDRGAEILIWRRLY